VVESGANGAIQVKLYPRTSIDNSRRVRELSHVVQLELMKSARKRMEKRIPKLAGSWLAGTFDKDRVVSRAANTGLSSFLTTDEKATQFWKKLQGQILDYALETVRETPDTLSDERSTTKDDAESKYYRVVGAALSLALNLLHKVGIDDVRKQFDEFLGAESVWALAAAEDSWVRKSVYQLAQTCLEKQPELVNTHIPQVGRALVSDALKVKQIGSAPDYVRVLTALSKSHPEVWGTKKHPLSRLQPFVEKGSQGSGPTIWEDLRQLITVVTQETVPLDVASNFLKALRAGISGREEPRAHAPHSWGCYLGSCLLVLGKLSSEKSRPEFLKESFYPLTEQYFYPLPERSSWNIAAPLTPVPKTWALSLLPKAWATVASYEDRETRQSFEGEWQRLAESFTSRMANSLPEVSKDFELSQQAVADEGERWFSIIGVLLRQVIDADSTSELARYLRETLFEASDKVIQASLDLLNKRNFKPFGAAAVIAAAARYWTPFLENDKNSVITSLFPTDRPEELKTMLASPSALHLLSCLEWYAPNYTSQYTSIWRSLVDTLLQSEDSRPNKTDLIAALMTPQKASTLAQEHNALQDYLVTSCLEAINETPANLSLIETALRLNLLTDASLRRLITQIVELLGSLGDSTTTALQALQQLLFSRSHFAQDEPLQAQLIAKLLAVKESSQGAVSTQVSALLSKLNNRVTFDSPQERRVLLTGEERSTLVGPQTSNGPSNPRMRSGVVALVRFLQENLDDAGQGSLK
jgi:hypothetical protein